MATAPRPALLRLLTIPAALMVAATACSHNTPDAPTTSQSVPTGRHGTPAPSAPSGAERETPMNIRVTLDGQPVKAVLTDSPAARDLASLLPLTLELEDFHGTERIGYPLRKLTTDGTPQPSAAKAGDLAYYAPWGNLALFYKNGPSPSADLLILGHLDVSAEQLAQAERITIEPAT
ncbi:cyclophilin-like fold protein [Streptomyces sp. NPDC056227]|uniref:cyclophilin-like fold protein n=1 Tax=Streptomyces sp. NPDC056227 TaxID=3345753 RepID=UPI0035E3A8D7